MFIHTSLEYAYFHPGYCGRYQSCVVFIGDGEHVSDLVCAEEGRHANKILAVKVD